MKVAMTNPKTGEVKEVKVGWSWILFLFSGFFWITIVFKKVTCLGWNIFDSLDCLYYRSFNNAK